MTINSPGRHLIVFRSVDRRGTTESWRSIGVGIDVTPPLAEMESPATAFGPEEEIRLAATGSDPGEDSSGIFGVAFSVCPADRTDDSSCMLAPGTRTSGGWAVRLSLEPGAYEAQAIAEDVAANSGSSNRSFFVVTGPQ